MRADKRLRLLKVAMIRDGLRSPEEPGDTYRWLMENGYLEPFEDSNGTPCSRVTHKGRQALVRGSFDESRRASG